MRRTSVDIAHPNAVSADISVRFWSNPALGNGTRGPVEIYNNTLLDEMPANNAIRSTSVTQNSDPNFVPMAPFERNGPKPRVERFDDARPHGAVTAVGLRDHADPVVACGVFGEDRGRLVRRPVVDDDPKRRAQALTHDAVERAAHVGRLVPAVRSERRRDRAELRAGA
jgi:hypothetical protein